MMRDAEFLDWIETCANTGAPVGAPDLARLKRLAEYAETPLPEGWTGQMDRDAALRAVARARERVAIMAIEDAEERGRVVVERWVARNRAAELAEVRERKAIADVDLVAACPYETRLAVAAWVMSHIVEHAEDGGSFRGLIYGRLGFGVDAYVPLYKAGGMTISNEFDLGSERHLAAEKLAMVRTEVHNECIRLERALDHLAAGTPGLDLAEAREVIARLRRMVGSAS